MRVGRTLLAIAMAGVFVLGVTPAHAARRVTCVLGGTVNLAQSANLTAADKGTGAFSPSALLQCTGAVGGAGAPSAGSFAFCRHNLAGTFPCHSTSYNAPNPNTDKIYDAINNNANPAKVVAHAKGSNIKFSGFTGGISCTLTFEGHAVGTVAELTIQSFLCKAGTVTKFNGKGLAAALAVPIPSGNTNCPPGPAKVCFKQLLFVGAITVTGP